MNSLLVFYLMTLQDVYNDNPLTSPPPGTAFSSLVDFFADALLAVGALLALLSAYRIYQKAMLSGENIMNGTTNLILGMILCLLTGSFIKLAF